MKYKLLIQSAGDSIDQQIQDYAVRGKVEYDIAWINEVKFNVLHGAGKALTATAGSSGWLQPIAEELWKRVIPAQVVYYIPAYVVYYDEFVRVIHIDKNMYELFQQRRINGQHFTEWYHEFPKNKR